MATLNSKIILARDIKIDRDYKHVLSYSVNDMLTLLRQNLIAESNVFSFINTTGEIRVPFTYTQCLQSNYIAFQNPNYDNQWFFAFIDSVVFKAEKSTEIKYTVDVWTTWFSKWQKKPCFVVREHVSDDTIGLHTVDENLNIGDVFCSELEEDEYLKDSHWIGVLSSWNPAKQVNKQFDGLSVYAGSVYGTELFLFNIENGFGDLLNFIRQTNKESHIGDISDIFFVSNTIAISGDLTYWVAEYNETIYQFATLQASRESYAREKNITKNLTWSSYTPRNNKCKCYPYNYLLVTNNVGNHNIYKYEDFANDNASFRIEETCAIGGSCRLVPTNYKGQNKNIDESLPLGKLPVCGWSADSFINWLTQNAVNISTRIVSNVVTAFAVPELGVSVANDTINLIGSFRQAMLAPNIEHSGSNLGDVNFTSGDNTFVFKKMRCKNEHMRVIDDFFTMYGYKVNTIKEPNIKTRQNWNYLEIGGSENIGYGSVPSNAMDIINNACRRGITIWHNHDNLGNYSLTNNII